MHGVDILRIKPECKFYSFNEFAENVLTEQIEPAVDSALQDESEAGKKYIH